MAKAMYRERQVRAGMALLDREAPGWEHLIDLDTLDVASGRSCVLGQVYESDCCGACGGFSQGVEALGLITPEAERHGFLIDTLSGMPYRALTLTWKALITERLAVKTKKHHVLVA